MIGWDGIPSEPGIERDHLICERIGGQRFTRCWWWDTEWWHRVGPMNEGTMMRSPELMAAEAEEYVGPVVSLTDLEAWIAEADVMRNRAWAALSLLPDDCRLHDLREAYKAIQRLIAAAEAMPRATPAPGDAGTVHAFEIEAGVVWELDVALRRLHTIQKGVVAA